MTLTALFRSARDAVRAEKTCRAAGLAVAVVPPPREISSECGMALRVSADEREQFEKLMNREAIYVTIHE